MRADNPGPFTLDGTRTHLVGRDEVAVVDPGPDDPDHIRALIRALGGARRVTVLVTHGHDDHAGGARRLARELKAPLRGFGPGADPLAPGEAVATDQGALTPVPTPGHARDHLAFHWPGGRAVFPGDLVLGEGDTTWVGAYAGCVRDYLASLGRIRELEPDVLYPAHGPPVRDPAGTLDRYREHRLARIRQVAEALEEDRGATVEELVAGIYGSAVPPGLVPAARKSVEVILAHLEEE